MGSLLKLRVLELKIDESRVLANHESFPEEATGEYGWIYHAATKTIRLDWPGTDSDGIRYYDY